MEQTGTRINKYLSESGVCSRREADRRIQEGEVTIDGRTAGMGDRVQPGQTVRCWGVLVQPEEEPVILLVNKPEGIVCTAEKREKNNIVDFIAYPKRVYPVGRLDKDSSGLILMTNQGELVNKLMRAGNYHEKEYAVTVNRPVTPEFLKGMAGGVPLEELGTVTRRCRVEQTGPRSFRIVLTQGLNRQIRRMCQYFGYRVVALKRVRILNLHLGDLAPGTYRSITQSELAELKKALRFSISETVRPQAKRQEPEKRTTLGDKAPDQKGAYPKTLRREGGQSWNKARRKPESKN